MVNTVLYPSDTWLNADGLPVRFARGAQVDAVVGAPWTQGETLSVVADIDFKRLPAFQSANTTGVIYGDYPNAPIPAGAYIKSVTIYVTTAFTGSGAVLQIGLVDKTGINTLSNTGLISATDGAVANLGAGAVLVGSGSLVKTVLANTYPAYYLWAAVTGASFTAGEGKMIVEYYMPDPVSHDFEA